MAVVGRTWVARYGSVALQRGRCPACEGTAFVRDGRVVCCNVPVEDDAPATTWKQESAPEGRRRPPPKAHRDAVLAAQDGRCLYCRRRFGSDVLVGIRVVTLCVQWDHFVPFVYAQHNQTYNFVAACQLCNRLKSSRCFQSVEEVAAYVARAWEKKGYTDLSGMPAGVPEPGSGTPVLHGEVPLASVEQASPTDHDSERGTSAAELGKDPADD